MVASRGGAFIFPAKDWCGDCPNGRTEKVERHIYLDYAATTPIAPEVFEEMKPFFLEKFGNPSSLHRYGQEAKEAIEAARARVAAFIGASGEEVFFTSGGTEADNWALRGALTAEKGRRRRHIITSQIEHPAVLNCCRELEAQEVEVTYLPVDGKGRVNPADVEASIKEGTALVSIMHANNEVGTIQPIEDIGRIARERGVLFHTDAVQSAGLMEIDVGSFAVDMLSLSSHKIYGPKGVGALFVRSGTRISPLIFGGEQEGNRRAGTENVPGIVGFGKACQLAAERRETEGRRLRTLKETLIEKAFAELEGVALNGDAENALVGLVSLAFEGVEAESLLVSLDLAGICASAGSACSSGALEPSHVLRALGLERARVDSSLRFSLGRRTTEEDIEFLIATLKHILARMRGSFAPATSLLGHRGSQ
jgi:cysteine desulfurase